MSYENTIYQKHVGMIRNDEGERFSAYVVVTKEVNGYAVFCPCIRDNEGLVGFFHNREAAIEFGIDRVKVIRQTTRDREYVRDDFCEESV